MLTRRITPMIRKAPNKNLANVTEALSTESIGSNSAIPSRDQQRCLNMAHQLKERNWRWILTKVQMRPETTVKNCFQKSFNGFLRAIIRTFVGIHHRRIKTTFKDLRNWRFENSYSYKFIANKNWTSSRKLSKLSLSFQSLIFLILFLYIFVIILSRNICIWNCGV